MPNLPYYNTEDGLPVNYVPGDWPEVAATQAANEEAFTSGEGQELSTAVQVTEAAQTDLDISGDERLWPEDVAAAKIGAPSQVNPNIANEQASQTPYVEYHLYP